MILTDQDYFQSIWAALGRIEDILLLPPAPLELPVPQVTVAAPNLTEIVSAINALGPSAEETAGAIAGAIARAIPRSEPMDMTAIVEVLKKLDFRMQGSQIRGGAGAASLAPGQTINVTGALTNSELRATAVPITSPFQTNQTGTWAYYAGASGLVNVTAGQRVLGIAAHSTAGGSMTINGGASVPIPANVAVQFTPMGTLVAPTLVFTGTDSFAVEVVSG